MGSPFRCILPAYEKGLLGPSKNLSTPCPQPIARPIENGHAASISPLCALYFKPFYTALINYLRRLTPLSEIHIITKFFITIKL